jgi:hypothetical protein
MRSRFAAALIAAAAAVAASRAAEAAEAAPSAPAAADELDDLRRRVADQDRRLAAMEEELRAARTPASAPGSADVGRAIDAYVKHKELTASGKSFLKFYGFIRMDAIYDDSRPNNTQTIAWVRSEDPTAPGGFVKDRADLAMHPRLTRFGFDLDAGKVESLGAKVTGKIEVDFYNSGLTGQSESRAALRMRHAWVKLGWENTSVTAGQREDLISPIFPIVNADLVMWGAGNLGDRRPQVRIEHTAMEGNLVLGAMVGLTGADDNADLDANTYRDGESAARPTVQLRAGYKFAAGGGKKGEFGIWAHDAKDDPDASILGHGHFDSQAFGIDLHLPVTETMTVRGELWQGRNLDDVRGGIFQGVNAATGDEVASRGGWVEFGYKAGKVWGVHVGHSFDNPHDGDISAGGRTENRIWYVANRFDFDPVEFGLDFLHWHTKFKGQRGGLDNRVQAYVAYKF